MEIAADEHGYLYVIMPSGEKLYILVDVPNCQHYGKLMLGKENEECGDQCGANMRELK
jgi:hypothetical protein